MAITNWPLWAQHVQAFQAALQQLVQLKKIPSGLTISTALPIYNVGLRDAIMIADLDKSAKKVGWRYFASATSEKTVVSGDVDLSPIPKLTSISYDPTARDLLAAIETAATSVAQTSADFEPRVLRVPGLLLECLWLSPIQLTGAEPGLVFPYRTLIKDLPVNEPADTFYLKLQVGADKAFKKVRPPATTTSV